MITLYLRWIREGRLTLDDVPPRWYDAVAAELEADRAES